MPTIADLQSRLKSLADQHARDLAHVSDRANDTATSLYRHLPSVSKGDGIFAQLKRSLTAIVEQARTDARDLGVAHTLTELRAIAGDKAGGISIPIGADPHMVEVAQYIDNAVDAARDAVRDASTETDRAEAFSATAYRAHTILDSEVTNQYRRARDTAHGHLRSMSEADTKALGFVVAKSKDDFRDCAVETRDGQKWIPIIGERWSTAAGACIKCREADGELRPFGFAFSLPGPTVHARCRCLRTLFCLAVPIGEDRASDEQTRNDRGSDRTDAPRDRAEQDNAMGDAARDAPYTGMLRAYTPEGERAPKVNAAARTVEVIVSTETVDSYDTKFIAAGLDLSRFKRNPILLSCHNSRDMKMILGTADIRVEGKKVAATMKFLPKGKSEEADRVFDLYESEVLRGVSHGFNPLEWVDEEEEGKGRNGRARYLRTFKRWEIVELSAVPVPSNPDALAREWREFDGGSQHSNAAHSTPAHRRNRTMSDNETPLAVLPPEIAAVLKVATIEDAVKEINKRALRVDELERAVEKSQADSKSAADKSAADLAAATKRAEDAEKCMRERNDAEATAYVDSLVRAGGLKDKTETREAALFFAKADLAQFRKMNPIPETSAAPMAHLLTQVVPPAKPSQAASVAEETREAAVAGNPIVAEKLRLQEEAKAAGKELSDTDAFNRAFKNVSDRLSKANAAH